MKSILSGIFVCGLSLLSAPSHAFSDLPSESKYAPRPGWHFVVNGGLTFGGDTFTTVTVTDLATGNSSEVDINMGRLLQYGVGGVYQFDAVPIAVKATINYQNDWALGINGVVNFSRVPVEILAYYTDKKRYRFGGGLRLIKSPKLEAIIDGSTDTFHFKETTGIVAEMGYQLSRELWVDLRYVIEKYQATTYVAPNGTVYDASVLGTYKGSHLGLILSYEF